MQVAKWGNSLAVRLPAAVVQALELKEGEEIELHVVGDRTLEVARKANECRDLALLAARWHGDIHRGGELRPATLVRMLERTDAFRRPERFDQLLEVCRCDFVGRQGQESASYSVPERLRAALAAARSVDAGAIARSAEQAAAIPELIHRARVAAVSQALAPPRDTEYA